MDSLLDDLTEIFATSTRTLFSFDVHLTFRQCSIQCQRSPSLSRQAHLLQSATQNTPHRQNRLSNNFSLPCNSDTIMTMDKLKHDHPILFALLEGMAIFTLSGLALLGLAILFILLHLDRDLSMILALLLWLPPMIYLTLRVTIFTDPREKTQVIGTHLDIEENIVDAPSAFVMACQAMLFIAFVALLLLAFLTPLSRESSFLKFLFFCLLMIVYANVCAIFLRWAWRIISSLLVRRIRKNKAWKEWNNANKQND